MPDQNSQQRQDRPLVIGITGHIGAGKTSVGKYLNSAYRFHYTRYSQVLSDWRAGDPERKSHLQAVGWEVMAGGMQAELNARLISQLPMQGDCVVDGLRHPLDYDSLNDAFALRFYMVYVSSSPELRWRRLQSRYPDLDAFCRADSHPVEQQIDSLRDKAFAVLDNSSSLKNLYAEVDAVLEKIRSGGPR
jgi:dephospho-CoA kinase